MSSLLAKVLLGGLGVVLAVELITHNGLIDTKTEITSEKGSVLPADKDPRPEENLHPGMVKPTASRPQVLRPSTDVGPALDSYAQIKPMINEEQAKDLNIQARFLYG